MDTRIALFQKKEIRKTLHENEWWFVVVVAVAALTGSANPAGYLKDMRRREVPLSDAFKGGGKLPPLALEFSTEGGPQKLLCWNTEGVFRLIQSIPSPKADPFKRWLAKVGYERVQEIEDPELAFSSSMPPARLPFVAFGGCGGSNSPVDQSPGAAFVQQGQATIQNIGRADPGRRFHCST